ncbi:unnamed protein product [Somion occarium]|uniref:ATP synthase protein MI25 n=1 Tax=Somion occarium TaxID=3059160 RepID=A0ABP1E0P9_9APHY
MSSTSIEPSSTTSDDPFFTDNPAATTTSGGGGGGGFASQSTPLYLFTFLATLFVLLFVSCAIVMRSFFLRRRMRQRIDEAIAAGVLLPPQTGPGSRRRDFGEKPKLWDASLSTPSDEDWESTTPVSVKLITSDSSSIPTSPSPPESSILRRLNPFAHLKSWRRPRSDAPSSPPDPTTLPLSQSHPGLDESIAHASDGT